ncbi:MAG: radical SAM family heme chaperone HemW [Candidatus Binatia bacterium]
MPSNKDKDAFALYVHIPYCISKCPYCDFNSHVVPKIPEEEYTKALLKELAFHGTQEAWHGRSLKSLFFGGGTPSTFHPVNIDEILRQAETLFPFRKDVEITLEANPGTVDSTNFSGYRSCGINRLSLGAQSFRPHLLKFLGRIHSVNDIRRALKITHQAGFENFNLDLIYACPGQSLSDLSADLREALSFHPPHLSAYNLTIEKGTPFHRAYQAGSIRNLPEEKEVSMAELVEETLSKERLVRYEISNYAKDGFHSRHNINYWQGGDYLGIGAGAHSYRQIGEKEILGHRWQNESQPARYMEMIEYGGRAVVGKEKTDSTKAAGEFMFLGLRLIQGISVQDFTRLFGKTPVELYPQIHDWMREGLMAENDQRLRLTRQGLLVANSIFVNFV